MRTLIVALLCAALPTSARASPAAAGAELPDFQGAWAQAQVTAAEVEVPVLGWLTSETVALSLLRVQQRGAELEIAEEVCSLHTESPTPMVRTVYPRALLGAFSGHNKRAVLQRAGGRVRYLEPRQVRVSGALLASPEEEALPTDPADPRVVDADGDGGPGITVEVEGVLSGRIFLVQRGFAELDGWVRAPGVVQGRITWEAEDVVLGATRDLLAKAPPKRPHPDPERSFFRMRRVPEGATCAEIIARRRALLGLE